ncbi:unnamed protein product [Heligmosomoides polygyrus]|uniref:Fibronectin type-III domain-containing protein n=1 Tax=Heligmosomoides polygyrus TaxID=6339 RepID=A0A183FEU3_HELPZ|nr:unnamed protein product [Heligmosomoides polygyrus]
MIIDGRPSQQESRSLSIDVVDSQILPTGVRHMGVMTNEVLYVRWKVATEGPTSIDLINLLTGDFRSS